MLWSMLGAWVLESATIPLGWMYNRPGLMVSSNCDGSWVAHRNKVVCGGQRTMLDQADTKTVLGRPRDLSQMLMRSKGWSPTYLRRNTCYRPSVLARLLSTLVSWHYGILEITYSGSKGPHPRQNDAQRSTHKSPRWNKVTKDWHNSCTDETCI